MILAIDPGIDITGYAVFRPGRGVMMPREIAALYVTSGTIRTKPDLPLFERLALISTGVETVCRTYAVRGAFVEVPVYHGTYRRRAQLGSKAREAVLGGDLSKMYAAIGAIVTALQHQAVPVEQIAPSTMPKAKRKELVAGFWPVLAKKIEDEVDAAFLALGVATDARRKWAA